MRAGHRIWALGAVSVALLGTGLAASARMHTAHTEMARRRLAGCGLARNPAPDPNCDGQGLAWSPDGTQLAVAGGAGIWLVTLGQPASAHLAIRAPCAEYPAFSPDGRRIAFDAPPPHALGEERAIMVANLDGSDLATLSDVPFRASVHPTWQPG
jgi:hypothetical protein